ncbi:MAG: nuclear transport factor 2 family protein [Xanthobacteraceae bacterium]|nr:nuclear transport factor 2 family protein [Xanthobacteraceae bacterium]
MNDFVDGDRFEENLDTRALVERHWKALESGNLDTEHWFYHHDAVLEYPQSGEVIVGRDNIKASRAAGPPRCIVKAKTVIGQDDLWVTEYTLSQDGKLAFAVSIMEFRDRKVSRETFYFADPLQAPAWRAQWARKQA